MCQSRTVWLVLSLVLAGCAGCGGDSSSVPTAPSSATMDPFVAFLSQNPGVYTATLERQTFTASGAFQVPLALGTYTINGSFTGVLFGVGFGSGLKGGVLSGSVRSLSGPSATVSPCNILYDNFATPSVNRTFSIQFQVTANAGSACQSPGL